MRRAAVTATADAIAVALRAIPGCSVSSTHQAGGGFPQLVVGFKGRNFILAIKPPGGVRGGLHRQTLSDAEHEWHRTWRGQRAIVTNVPQALYACGLEAVQAAQDRPGRDNDYREAARAAADRTSASKAKFTFSDGMAREFEMRLRGSDEHR